MLHPEETAPERCQLVASLLMRQLINQKNLLNTNNPVEVTSVCTLMLAIAIAADLKQIRPELRAGYTKGSLDIIDDAIKLALADMLTASD